MELGQSNYVYKNWLVMKLFITDNTLL